MDTSGDRCKGLGNQQGNDLKRSGVMIGLQRLNGCARKRKIQSTPHRKMVASVAGGAACSGAFALDENPGGTNPRASSGRKELACGSQAFIATLLFDSSKS
jgi:hypothetical protein